MGVLYTKCVNVCVHKQEGVINKWSKRNMWNTIGTTLITPQEDLWIRTAWRSAGRETRSLSTWGEQEGICGIEAMNFIDISPALCLCACTCVCVSVCVCVWKRQRGRVWETDQRHQPALLPSCINCKSVTAFHCWSLQHIWMQLQVQPLLFHKPQREKGSQYPQCLI